MPRPALTSEEIDAFRQKAVVAATSLFAEHGVDGVSMRRLAAEMGCSAMTPYRYFENRDALFAMVRTAAFRRFADRQRDAAASTKDPMAQLVRLKEAYVAFAVDEPDAYRIMFELRQRPTGTYPELAAEGARGFSYFHDAVVEAIATGALQGDPLTVAHLLWAGAHGIVSLHLAGKLAMGRSLQDLCDHLVPIHAFNRS
jgi:AcrR family transcriptional regulator